jgi:hypothetical protein
MSSYAADWEEMDEPEPADPDWLQAEETVLHGLTVATILAVPGVMELVTEFFLDEITAKARELALERELEASADGYDWEGHHLRRNGYE